MIKTHNIDDMSRVSLDIPLNVKGAICDALIAFNRMEGAAEGLIWALTGLDFEDGKLLTGMDARPKSDLLRKLLDAKLERPLGRPPKKQFWMILNDLRAYRNQIAHGMWIMVDGSTPTAVSFRPAIEDGRIISDAFPVERLVVIADKCAQATRVFARLEQHVQKLRSASAWPLPRC